MTDEERATAFQWISHHIRPAHHWRQYAHMGANELKELFYNRTNIYLTKAEFVELMRLKGYEYSPEPPFYKIQYIN